jgi:hypothetical protein
VGLIDWSGTQTPLVPLQTSPSAHWLFAVHAEVQSPLRQISPLEQGVVALHCGLDVSTTQPPCGLPWRHLYPAAHGAVVEQLGTHAPSTQVPVGPHSELLLQPTIHRPPMQLSPCGHPPLLSHAHSAWVGSHGGEASAVELTAVPPPLPPLWVLVEVTLDGLEPPLPPLPPCALEDALVDILEAVLPPEGVLVLVQPAIPLE